MAADPTTINFQIPPGVKRVATPAVSQGRWWDANLIRWHGGAATPVKGWQKQTTTALASTPRAMISWQLNNGTTKITAIACDQHLYAEDGDAYNDITPTGFVGVSGGSATGGYGSGTYSYDTYGTPRAGVTDPNKLPSNWSLATWGEELLFVGSTDGKLYKWAHSSPVVIAAAITGAPISNRAMVVTNERHVMLIGTEGNARRIAWSSREDYTDWNYASTTNTAGFLDVDTDTPLLGAVVVRDGVLVYSASDVFLVRFVGSPFVYGAEKIGTDTAPISPRAMTAFEGRAAWMGKAGMWTYDGGGIRPIPCEVQDWLYETIEPSYAKSAVVSGTLGVLPEVWWFFPSSASDTGENDRYLFWSYVDNYWSIGTMARTCLTPAGTHILPLMGHTDGHIRQHETGYLNDGATRVGQVYAETGAMSLGPGEQLMVALRAQPDSYTGANATRFTIFSRFTREGAETTHGPYTTRSNGYMDLRLTGRDVRVRVEANADQNWTVGDMRMTVAPAGKR